MPSSRIAEAYVQVVPRVDGFSSNLKGQINGDLTAAGVEGGDAMAKGTAEGFGSKIKSLLGPAIIAAGAAVAFQVGSFVKGSIEAASDFGESANAIRVSYGDAADGIAALGETAATRLGLSGTQFNEIATQFSGVASKLAGPGGDVVKVIDDLTTRGADFASVMNMDVNEALALFQSGLAGETEGLRRYGIDLSAASVEAYAMANGIGTAGKELSEAEKQQARYGLLLESTNKVAGDFGNTSDGLANQQRIFSAQLENTQTVLGNVLLPVFTELFSVLNTTVIPVMEQFFTDLKNGKTPLNDIGNAIGGFIGFVRDNWSWISILGAAIAGAGLAMVAVNAAFTLGATIQATYATITATVTGVQNLFKIATGAATAQQLGLNAAMLANPIGIVVAAIAALVAGLVYFFTQTELGKELWQNFVDALGMAWTWLWENALKPGFDAITAAWNFLIDKVVKPVVALIMLYIGLWAAAFEALWKGVIEPTIKFIGNAFEFLYKNVIKPTIDFIMGALKSLGDFFKSWVNSVVKPVLDAFSAAFRFIYDNVVKPVAGFIGTTLDNIGQAFRNVFGGVSSFMRDTFNALVGIIKTPLNSIIGFINKVIDALNTIQVEIPDWVPVWGGYTFGINIPNIPKLAEGGFVNSPTMALIGEAGPEVVVPLDRFEQMVGLGDGGNKTVVYNAAPNQSLTSEQALFRAMKRAEVIAGW